METVTSMWGEEPASQERVDAPPQADTEVLAAVLKSPTVETPTSPWAGPARRMPELPAAPEPALDPTPEPAAVAQELAAPVARLAPLRTPAHVHPPAPVPTPAPAFDDTVTIWVPDLDRVPPPHESTSSFESWLKTPVPRRRGARVAPPGRRQIRSRRPPRRPGVGLTGLVLLSLLAAFFAWVSVEPLWLAIGHGDRGTATVTRCTGTGVGQRCVGEFTATGDKFTVNDVAVLGATADQRSVGATMTARMVSSDSRSAYASDRAGLHLRWAIGLVLILACGLGIALATGATRLDSRGARLSAFATSLAAPLLIALGFLAASF